MYLSFTLVIAAPPEVVWPYLVETNLRQRWETDLEDLVYDAEPALGATGTMKLAGMPAMPFRLVAFSAGSAIADQVDTPDGGTLTFAHDITPAAGGCQLTQSVRLDKDSYGLQDVEFLAQVFADTPQDAWRLKTLAEQ